MSEGALEQQAPHGRSWRQIAKYAVATAVLSLLSSFIAVSEASLKAFIEDWVEGCLIVIKSDVKLVSGKGRYLQVELYPSGDVPDRIDLVFASRNPSLYSVRWDRDWESHNLAFHRLSGKMCPGSTDICTQKQNAALKQVDDDVKAAGSSGSRSGAPDITINIPEFHPRFSYKFNVGILDGPDNGTDVFGAYVLFPQDIVSAGKGCRVQRADMFNILVGSSNHWKFAFFVLVFIFCAGGVLVFRRWGNVE